MEEGVKLNQLAQLIKKSRYMVFFGGAGTSTESGIKDFRSVDGLYREKWAYPPETILSHRFFARYTEEFYRFYREKMLSPDAQPHAGHMVLARLEAMGKCKAIITQNIDGLHQKAGSKEVLELHGSTWRNACVRCGKEYSLEELQAALERERVPHCVCGGVLKPDVVLYEESLDEIQIGRAISHIRRADLLIVGGTSLTVYPAAGFLDYFQGENLVLMNREETSRDRIADLIIRTPIGVSLERMMGLYEKL